MFLGELAPKSKTLDPHNPGGRLGDRFRCRLVGRASIPLPCIPLHSVWGVILLAGGPCTRAAKKGLNLGDMGLDGAFGARTNTGATLG